MGLSLRLLMIDRADRIYRLDTSRLERMRANPKRHPLPQFAGERVRGAEAVVELVGCASSCQVATGALGK